MTRWLGMPRLLFAVLVLASACSSPSRIAQRQLEAAEQAMATLPPGAADIVPDQVTALTAALDVGRQAITAGDYQAASGTLQTIPDQVRLLRDSIPVREAALRAEMDTLMILVPRNLDAIQGELDRIGRTGRRPSGLSGTGLMEVRQIRDSAGILWNEVQGQFRAGKLAEAMNKAHDLKARVSRALLALGLVGDERAWSNVTLPPG